MTETTAEAWIHDPAGLAARGTLNHLEHGFILAAVQMFEGAARAFLYLLLELVAPDLMNRAFAARSSATPPAPPTSDPAFRFLLAPPPHPNLDRIAGLLGEALAPEQWRVTFRFFRASPRGADSVSASYTLRIPDDPHAKLRTTLQQAAIVLTRETMPALPLARRIEAARRVFANPRAHLARIIQRLHKQPDLMMRCAPRIADPANDASPMPTGPTTQQMIALAEPLVRLEAPVIAALFPALPKLPDSS